MKRFKTFKISIFLIALIINSCTTSSLEQEYIEDLFLNTPSEKFELIADGGYASYDLKAQNIVIKDKSAFEQLWSDLNARISPTPPIPEINFSEHMVLATIMGRKPNGGFGTWIDKAIYLEETLAVKVVKSSQGENCFTTQAVTTPYYLVKIRKTDFPVAFYEESVVHDCSE